MYIKDQLQTNKIKSICFHPKQYNWIAIGLYTGDT